MTTARVIRIAVLLLIVRSTSVAAQSGHDLFQQALTQERAYGDLELAIGLYERIAEEFAEDRELVAWTLVALGGAYEKLGRPESQVTYRRVRDDYADQTDAAREARARLAAMASAGRGNTVETDPTLVLVLDELAVGERTHPTPFDFSPDGSRVVFRQHALDENPPGLYIADRGGNVVLPLITIDPANGPAEGLWNPRWSPDGERIAFTALFPGRDEVVGLYVIDVTGGTPERLGDSFGIDLCWTPDGTAITHVGDRDGRLHLTSIGARNTDVPLGDPLPLGTLLGGYSPDGTRLALDIRTERFGRVMRDVWIMAAESGERFHVTDAPGMDSDPTWGADGSLYFTSDRGGSANIWKLDREATTRNRQPPARLRSGTRRGESLKVRDRESPLGQPVQVTFFRESRVAYPRRIRKTGGVAFVAQSVTNTIRVAESSLPHDSRSVIRGLHPQLSPDGTRVFFESDTPGSEGVFRVSKGGGRPTRLIRGPLSGVPGLQRFQLSPDGTAIAYVGRLDAGRAILAISSSAGAPWEVARLTGNDATLPAWSPDGSRIAFANGRGLHVVSRDGGTVARVGELSGWDGHSVRWSPDGEQLAALGWETRQVRGQLRNDVFVVPASGGELRRLSPEEEREYKEGLEWQADGRSLTYKYYDPDRDGDGLRAAYTDGRPTTLFLDAPATWDYVGKWNPDGTAFYFIASDKDRPGWQLYRRGLDGGTPTEVASGDDIGLPSWSRDGSAMVFSVKRITSQLWIMEDFR